MKTTTYTLKVSSQSQLTLPRHLREQLQIQPGSRVTVTVADDSKSLQISSELPIEKHFGALRGAWTLPSQDASDYTRELRDQMQPDVTVGDV